MGQVSEAWLVCGRRAGKSFMLPVVATFLAAFRDWRPYLGPGERGTVMIIAADRKQARVIMRYVLGLLKARPMLSQLIEAERQEGVDLTNRITIEVHTASFRTVRGYSVVAARLDEAAFWQGDGTANPDVEIITALRPAMATVPNAMLLCASSPYARRGALWEAHKRHFGKEGSVLVWQADTRTMNPTVPQKFIDDALEADPLAASAECLAEFRTDVESFISREALEGVSDWSTLERPPLGGNSYVGFVDPSGGSSDSFTLAIAHADKEAAVLDVVREVRPPFSPEAVVAEFSDALKSYRVTKINGDRYSGEWCREAFRKKGIRYEPAGSSKSDLYRDLLPLVNSTRVRLLGNNRLIAQLIGLSAARRVQAATASTTDREGTMTSRTRRRGRCSLRCSGSQELAWEPLIHRAVFIGRARSPSARASAPCASASAST